MRVSAHQLPGLCILVVAALAIISGESGHVLLFYLCKPLTTILIASLVWRSQRRDRYQRAMALGMVFSLGGDIFLMLPESVVRLGFVLGLASFLLAHLCFLRALLSDSRFAARPLVFAMIAALGAVNLWLLWPGIPADLRIPVIAYVACLLSMTAQAVSRYLGQPGKGSAWAASAGLVFMLSDTLIAYNRFYTPLPWPTLLVLLTYYFALWGFARSVQDRI